ncbi:metallophosphoesterase [Mahella australiensis]|uniref:Metallophosphoesterase n=1 Tax=Mahella australiensis (strain DSM 15567 / CIP 107919 / 50-1 BON) TaxID=697281 RepID=F3ZXM1_MAHA5|nr:metallophosphoesterase [Mahella australiensis]AEE95528.1 metallophosphoesterase [Mahella australiensis 50-1 BON]
MAKAAYKVDGAATEVALRTRIRSKRRKNIIFVAAAIFALILLVLAFWQGIIVRHYTEKSDKLTAPIRMMVLSDLHSTIYGKDQKDLIEIIHSQAPDVIFLVGDIADDRVPHDGTKQLIARIGKEYPCYYVSGNHEYWSGEIGTIKGMMRASGIMVLEGDSKVIEINGQSLRICGVDDPDGFLPPYKESGAVRPAHWSDQLEACDKYTKDDIYTILLSHRPEKVNDYNKCRFDLILCGHAHGGQVRIPGILNGLYAPNQGFFPKYVGGYYKLENSTMIVSRGLVKNDIPRIFNPPEIVIIDVKPTHPL